MSSLVPIVDVAPLVRKSVNDFDGEREYVATGDIDISAIIDSKTVTFQDKPSRANIQTQPGDVIVARMAGTEKVILIDEEKSKYIFSTGMAVFRPSSEIDSRYLFHFLKTDNFNNEKDRLSSGATQKAIADKSLKRIKIPLLPIEEQRRIAVILDKAGEVERTSGQIQEMRDEIIQATFLDMFGDPVANPKDFQNRKLSEVSDIFGGGTPSKSNPQFWGGDIPWISPKDMKKLYLDDSKQKITKAAIESSATKLIHEGSILIVTRSGILKHHVPLAITKASVTINQDIKAFRPHDVLNSIFLLFQLINRESELLSKVRMGATVHNFRTQTILDVQIIIPPIELQNQFADIVRQITAMDLSALETQATTLKQALTQELLA